jgi:hypothetical protein
MTKLWRIASLWLLILMLGGLAAACNDQPDADLDATPMPTATPTPTPTPTPEPISAEMLLAQASDAMQSLRTTRFLLTRSGGDVFLDLGAGTPVLFNSAFGNFVAPDTFQARINLAAFGAVLEVQTIAIGDEQWLTDPLTRQWSLLPAELSFNPAILFDPAVGWQALLTDGVQEATLVGEESLSGKPYTRVDVVLSGDSVGTVTAGLAQGDDITVSLWLEPETSRVAQMRFTTPADEAADGNDSAEWLLGFDQFDEPIVIIKPSDGQRLGPDTES